MGPLTYEPRAVARATMTAIGALILPTRKSVAAISTQLRLSSKGWLFHFLHSSALAKRLSRPTFLPQSVQRLQ